MAGSGSSLLEVPRPPLFNGVPGISAAAASVKALFAVLPRAAQEPVGGSTNSVRAMTYRVTRFIVD